NCFSFASSPRLGHSTTTQQDTRALDTAATEATAATTLLQAGAPYQGYGASSLPPQPYSFGYDTADEFGNRQFRSEQGDASNVKTGSYGYRDVNGLFRRVNYIADANGFRATVDTNEPGTAPGASADAVFNASPVVPPVPGGAAAQNTYGAGAGAPAYNGYAGFGSRGYESLQ
ncbi:cuticle protein 10.9-like, partial [Dermacentor silvarum]|uniref:cuticle protein 10.9-like n=1 Tax=Dermacentor silvarum TaxID=543639 RepID=UPI00210158D0